MSDMKLYEAMSTMRAVRKLRPDPIPGDVLARVFEAATFAPTGGNRQPWRMIAVTGTEAKTRLGELYKARWNDYAAVHKKGASGLSDEQQAKEQRTLAAGDHLADHMKELPVLVVVCFNPKYMAVTDAGLDRVSVVGGGSIYPAVENLLLAARAEGLGCVLTTLLCMEEGAVKDLLGIPDEWGTAAMIPLGYPVGKGHGPITRKPVTDLFFAGKWGEPYA